MYGLRYGSIPVVRATGGLNDTVQDPRERRFPGTGFKFEEFDPAAFLAVVERANTVYKDNSYWQAMMREGMAQDFSWRRSAEEYLKVFEKAIRSKRGEDK